MLACSLFTLGIKPREESDTKNHQNKLVNDKSLNLSQHIDKQWIRKTMTLERERGRYIYIEREREKAREGESKTEEREREREREKERRKGE